MKSLTAEASRLRLLHLLPLCFLAAALFLVLPFCMCRANANQLAETDLTVHEWGTFTSIAGPDGLSMDWLPLTGSTDLPSFVEHFREVAFKGGLRGTTRMETPVLYFYSTRETTVSVNVSFDKGLITEWYPHADSANLPSPLAITPSSTYNLPAPSPGTPSTSNRKVPPIFP